MHVYEQVVAGGTQTLRCRVINIVVPPAILHSVVPCAGATLFTYHA